MSAVQRLHDPQPVMGEAVSVAAAVGLALLAAHLVVRDLRQWETVLDASHVLLAERFGIQHATLQPEPMVRTVRWLDARDGASAYDHLHDHPTK